MMTLPDRLFELLVPGDNILLLSSVFNPAGSEACIDLLTLDHPHKENVLAVTYTKSPCDRYTLWKQNSNYCPKDAAIINIETMTRSTASAVTDDNRIELGESVSVEHITSPSDLTSLGVAITNQLDEWNDETVTRQIVACIHSVTSLLQYVDFQQTFKFLDALTRKFTDADAIAHFHMDPDAHDDQTLQRLFPLFDIVCGYENQEWSLRSV